MTAGRGALVRPGPVLRAAGRTLTEILRRELEEAIVKGTLAPGDRLEENDIAQRYGVSRTPVREAFRLLGADGLVEQKSRQGVVVRKISIATLLEMFQVMAELEGLCARLAARRIAPARLRDLEAIHARLTAAGHESDVERFYAVNQEFHELIYDAARNGFLAEQVRQLRNRVAPFRRRVTYKPHRFDKTLVEHEAVLAAIRAHDADRADVLMRDHVNLLGDDLVDFVAVWE
ncbi:GntR family transcriptional regulator [Rhodoplanes azumiensis]|uniref:GntR family transcriptional regulator n=1 Tax=Rhodoplanes azumiensis TaxID=1897628 RepID=A0ABW5AMA7_9BRAD